MAPFATTYPLMYLEPFLWFVALLGFLRLKIRATFPSFGIYLALRTFAAFAVATLPQPHNALALSVNVANTIGFYVYWIGYLLGFVALFFTLQEIFNYAVSRLPGLARLGGICFRWAALVSLFIAFGSMLPSLLRSPQDAHLAFVFLQIAAGLCALELCMVAFLMVAIRALGLSSRSYAFGICLGLAIMAAGDFSILSAQAAGWFHWLLPLALETETAVCLLLWLLYFVLPEPKKQPDVVPVAALMEWNDLALALGQNLKEQPSQAGFLHDVESVVDRVLAKNAAKNY